MTKLSSSPAITTLLLSKGKNTIGHETNLARSPIWQSRPHNTPDDTVVSPILFGHPFRRVEGHCLTTADQRLFAHLTTNYVRSGCPDSRQVAFSLGDAANAVGHDVLGGRQRSLMRLSLARLRSVTFESAVRYPDGHQMVLGWGLIDSYLVTTHGGGKGWVTLSEPVANLLREGSVTFLHAPTWEAICAEDEVAGRLWSYLESENIGAGWRYSLFAPDGPGKSPSMPSIADICQLQWSTRKRVADRVRKACSVIESRDRRYRLTLTTGREVGTWVLTCTRSHAHRAVVAQAIPHEVISAWRGAYRSYLPSKRQRAVLVELLDRHSSDWIVDQLQSPGSGDAFECLLDADRTHSSHAMMTARIAEEAWAEVKAKESSTAEQSLAELIGIARRRA